MRFDIITIFPDLFPPYLNESLLKHAQKKGLLEFQIHNLRDYATGRYHVVDDRPYGGGPGMILKAEPIIRCLQSIQYRVSGIEYKNTSKRRLKILHTPNAIRNTRIVALDPDGKQLTQAVAKRLARYDQLILLAGRYEGFDERVYKFVDEKISIGPYVLLGGELPALVLIDSVSRMIPGVVGDPDSIVNETHSSPGYVEYPQYTRPERLEVGGWKLEAGSRRSEVRILKAPKVLLSGDHKRIEQWRKRHARHKRSAP